MSTPKNPKNDENNVAAGKPERSRATRASIGNSNGRLGYRSPSVWIRAEEAFERSLAGVSTRKIALEMGVGKSLVARWVRAEYERREAEFQDRRDSLTIRIAALYEDAISRAQRRNDMVNDILLSGGKSAGDNSVSDLVSATDSLARLYGLGTPTRVDIGMDKLIEALRPRDDVVE